MSRKSKSRSEESTGNDSTMYYALAAGTAAVLAGSAYYMFSGISDFFFFIFFALTSMTRLNFRRTQE